MAVSAVESRLYYHLEKTEGKSIHEHKETLGSLILKMDNANQGSQTSFNFPKRHFPLMKLLNEYRIFSAHPKKVKVGSNIAKAARLSSSD